MRVVLLGVGVLAGCVAYQPGSFVSGGQPFAGERAVVGCLDLALSARREPVARGPVVDYQFGNHCDRAVTIDLGAVRVTGRTATGEEVAMTPFDPDREIRPVPLDGRRAGRERVEYRVARDLGGEVVQVCLDLAAVTPGAGPSVTCLAGERVAAVQP